MAQTLSQKLNQFPPGLCRFIARKSHGRFPMSHTDVAKVSGLSRALVIKLSNMATWGNTGLLTIEKFTSACGVDPLRPAAAKKYLRRRKLAFIENATPAQRRMFGKLLRRPRNSAPPCSSNAQGGSLTGST